MNQVDFLKAVNLEESSVVEYTKGYKYQLRKDMIIQTFIFPDKNIITPLVILRKDGWMLVSKYFAWDGASGPTYDDNTNMRGSLFHDGLGYLFRTGLLDIKFLPPSGELLRRLMVEDGAWKVRADYYMFAVNKIYTDWALPKNAKEVFTAP